MNYINISKPPKHLFFAIWLGLWAALASCQAAHANPTLDLLKPLATATNWSPTVYATHFDNNNALGGGLLVIYNFNDYVGAGLGADWAGNWRVFGGDLQIKKSFIIWNHIVTPFAIAGVQSPVGGAGQDNGGLATVVGGGADIQIWNKLHIAGGWLNRTSCGTYSGGSEFISASWRF